MEKWKYKAFAQKAFSAVPCGERLNYFCQKHVTRNYPLSFETFNGYYKGKVLGTIAKIERYSSAESYADKSYYEFGAGWELLAPIGLAKRLRLMRLYLVDIRELVRPELIRDTLQKYAKLLGESDPPVLPKRASKREAKQFLADNFNIHYSVQDAAKTSFADNSIDYVASRAVLEHVPQDSIGAILKESHRIVTGGGC